MKLLAACPAGAVTGGPEALHEFVHNMNKLDGVDALVWYWGALNPNPTPDEYRHYGCNYVTDLIDCDAIVFPEIYADHALDYPNHTRAIWWLGVDAYAAWTDEPGAFLKDDKIIHIAQSEYAYTFLRTLGVKRLHKLTDRVNADFHADYIETEREDVVLYNPVKATPFMDEIMTACPDITFKPIQNMTRAEVIETMRRSKLYIDFGTFPGRERMPREAVLCGCCLITGKIGAAGYVNDFAHDYKFESKDSHIWAIRRKIHEALDNYDECRHDFDLFRELLQEPQLTNDYKHIAEVLNEV